MNLGTLSEKRTKPITTTTASPPPTEKGEGIKVLEKLVESIKKEPTPKEPTLVVEAPKTPIEPPQPTHVQDTKCTYCKMEAITTLAIRGSIVLVLLALCFKLIKTAK